MLAGALAAGAQSLPPWPAGDEIGMANTLGPATWARCAPHSVQPEIEVLRGLARPLEHHAAIAVRYAARGQVRPTVGIPGTRHAFNGEEAVSGEAGAQGTQMDALGHFAVLPEAWDGKGEFPSAPRFLLRRPHAGAGEAQAGFAVAQARHRQGAADHHDGGAARRQNPSRRRQADAAGPNSSPPRTSRRC